jgi:uncharacterized protein (DUF58 family)
VFVYVLAEGITVATISAAEIAGAFVLWGVLMAFTGACATWVFTNARARDAEDDAEQAAAEAEVDNTVEIRWAERPAEHPRQPPRVHRTGTVHVRRGAAEPVSPWTGD